MRDLHINLVVYLVYAFILWLALRFALRTANRFVPPHRRIRVGRRTWFFMPLLNFLGILLFTAVTRPPSWRYVMYEEMVDTCGDGSMVRARFWLLLGASPDGGSDYAASAGYHGLEFGSCLTTVVDHRHHELLKLLLERGANPNFAAGDGSTPLNAAGHNRDPEAIKLLVAAGATPRHWPSPGEVWMAGRIKYYLSRPDPPGPAAPPR